LAESSSQKRQRSTPRESAGVASGLSAKQRKFVAEYLKDGNGTQAAIRAGYSAHTANEQASALLAKPSIRAAVEGRLEKVEVRSDDVLRELKRIAYLDLTHAYKQDGSLKLVHEIPEDTRRALVGIEVDEIWDGYGEDRTQIGVTKKVKFADKIRALELLGKHLELFTEKVKHSADSSFAEMLKEARARVADRK
jgi:phage terminase small subunit